MKQANKVPAFLSYLLLVFGWLYVFLSHREDKLAIYHTKQSMMLVIVVIGAPIVWAIVAWVLAFIPYAGPILAVSAFSMVIALYIALAIIWIIGMVNAWQTKLKPLPLIGHWAEHLPFD